VEVEMATIDEKFRNKKAALETDLPALQERILDIRAQRKALEKEL